jgi:hypothetical protein
MNNKINKFRKGQSLPLNTIVIALLVIIVMVVIIAFFVSNTSKAGDEFNRNSVTQCTLDNAAITSLGYKSVNTEKIKIPTDPNNIKADEYNPTKNNCKSGEEIKFVRTKVDEEYIICCGTK